MSATSIVILISIVAAVALGYKLKINIGLFGLAFAFLFGCFLAGMSPGKVMGMWPTKLFFQMFTVTFFYAFAQQNGTLELIARKLVYRVRHIPWLIPIVVWIVTAVLAGIGPGSVAMFLCLAPLIMQIVKETEVHPALGAVILGTAASGGAWSPIAVNGITTAGLIEQAGYSAAEAATFGLAVWRNMFVVCVILFAIGYVIFRGYRAKPSTIEAPAPFNKKQVTTMVMILLMLIIIVVPNVLKGVTGNAAIAAFAGKLDITFLAVLFSIAAIILKVGDEKKALAGVPWHTIVMMCGVGMLVAVASESGALEYLSSYIGETFNPSLVPFAMVLVAGVMSFFSSTMGVVVPTLYPLVFAICTLSGANPVVLFSVIPIAAICTGHSPVSLSGGLCLANTEESQKNRMFFILVGCAVGFLLLVLAFVGIGIIR